MLCYVVVRSDTATHRRVRRTHRRRDWAADVTALWRHGGDVTRRHAAALRRALRPAPGHKAGTRLYRRRQHRRHDLQRQCFIIHHNQFYSRVSASWDVSPCILKITSTSIFLAPRGWHWHSPFILFLSMIFKKYIAKCPSWASPRLWRGNSLPLSLCQCTPVDLSAVFRYWLCDFDRFQASSKFFFPICQHSVGRHNPVEWRLLVCM